MSFGWRHEFRERDWAEVRSRLADVNWAEAEADYLFQIIDSVLAAGADKTLALATSMHDLVIAQRPVGDPPLEVLLVAAPGSLRRHAQGTVRIDYIAINGENTEIERGADEAVALFWRFLQVEFGMVRADGSNQ